MHHAVIRVELLRSLKLTNADRLQAARLTINVLELIKQKFSSTADVSCSHARTHARAQESTNAQLGPCIDLHITSRRLVYLRTY